MKCLFLLHALFTSACGKYVSDKSLPNPGRRLAPGYGIRYKSPRCCCYLMTSQKGEGAETCTVNMNFTKSPQANSESSLEKGRGFCLVPITSFRPPPAPFYSLALDTGIFLLTLMISCLFCQPIQQEPGGTVLVSSKPSISPVPVGFSFN